MSRSVRQSVGPSTHAFDPATPQRTHAPEVARLDVVHPGQPRRRGAVGPLGEEALQLRLRLRGAAAVLQHLVQLVAVCACVRVLVGGEESGVGVVTTLMVDWLIMINRSIDKRPTPAAHLSRSQLSTWRATSGCRRMSSHSASGTSPRCRNSSSPSTSHAPAYMVVS